MHDGSIVAIVAIVFGTLYSLARMIFRSSSSGERKEKATDAPASHNQRELFDLAVRLQNRVETLERLLDNSQPEWRGKP